MKKGLTNREVLIMKCVWDSEKQLTLCEAREVLREMFDWDAKRSTIRTFLTDMEHHGYVKVERRGRHSYIIPLLEKEVYIKKQAKKFVDFWFDGSKEKLLKSLTEDI